MTEEIREAQDKIVEVLKDLPPTDPPLTLSEVVERVQSKNADVMERYIRPSFWFLVSAGKIKVDSSFRGELAER